MHRELQLSKQFRLPAADCPAVLVPLSHPRHRLSSGTDQGVKPEVDNRICLPLPTSLLWQDGQEALSSPLRQRGNPLPRCPRSQRLARILLVHRILMQGAAIDTPVIRMVQAALAPIRALEANLPPALYRPWTGGLPRLLPMVSSWPMANTWITKMKSREREGWRSFSNSSPANVHRSTRLFSPSLNMCPKVLLHSNCLSCRC